MKDFSHYTSLAEMFRYPSDDMEKHIPAWRRIVACYDNRLMDKLQPFIDHITGKTLPFRQEYFVDTFDVQPLSCMDIGYVLYGEEFKRGEFLANIKKEQMNVNNDCGSDLADHLPNILTLLPKLKDEAFREELVYSLLIPALSQMILKFRAENIYKGLFQIILAVMKADYPVSAFGQFRFKSKSRSANFLAGKIKKEI